MSLKNDAVPDVAFTNSFRRKIGSLFFKAQRSYPILWGPLRGIRLEYSDLTQFHFLLGLYDHQWIRTTEKVIRHLGLLNKNFVACDLGANIGYFSLWLSKLASLAPEGHVYSFEPNQKNVEQIKRNILCNRFKNVSVLEQAVSDQNGFITFFEGCSTASGSLVESWAKGNSEKAALAVEVSTTTLDSFFERGAGKGKAKPTFIKVDIEGAGETALSKMKETIQSSRPLILIESHLPGEDKAISDLITELDYEAFRFNDEKWVESRSSYFPNKQGVWGTLILVPQELSQKAKEIL